jgi:Mg-chelatase subunit ChlD
VNVQSKKDYGSETVEQIKKLLQNRNFAELTGPLKQDASLSAILLEEDLFNRLIQEVELSGANWSILQFLFMNQSKLDAKHRQLAKAVLNRTVMRIAAKIAGHSIHAAEYVMVPFRPGVEEIDLEETIENCLGKAALAYDDIVCVERRPKKRAVSLALDISNSMQAGKLLIAALAVGVFAYLFSNDHYSVITFSEGAHLLKPIKEEPDVEKLIDKMLDLEPGGSTNIEAALRVGIDQLERLLELDGTGVLITDGWVTRGGDPVEIARKYQKLHVIQVPLGVGGGDSDMCERLALAGSGKHSYVRDFNELPQAILGITK